MKSHILSLIFLVLLLVFTSFNFYAQAENALPPGPARIFGTVFFENKPLSDIEVILLFEREGLAQKQVFKTNQDGRFTVYVNNGIENFLVCVVVENKVRYIYIPENISEGTNYFKDFVIDSKQKIKIKDKKYRRLLKE